jgi:NAD(P)-dependent dehydrogenase (short-subunit alcohol dehydrogenase family)
MDIEGAVALVTGANRGIGRHFAQQLLERGAAKVYATARDPERVDVAGAEVLPLDVTDPASVAGTASYDGANSYASAKAAQWALTNGVRLELAPQRTLVAGLHMGGVDTDMMAAYDVDKLDPADVVRTALNGIQAGALEILVDDASRQVKAALALDPSALYPQTVPAA